MNIKQENMGQTQQQAKKDFINIHKKEIENRVEESETTNLVGNLEDRNIEKFTADLISKTTTSNDNPFDLSVSEKVDTNIKDSTSTITTSSTLDDDPFDLSPYGKTVDKITTKNNNIQAQEEINTNIEVASILYTVSILADEKIEKTRVKYNLTKREVEEAYANVCEIAEACYKHGRTLNEDFFLNPFDKYCEDLFSKKFKNKEPTVAQEEMRENVASGKYAENLEELIEF